MATKNVLKKAINQLKINSKILREKKEKCVSQKEIEEINKQLSQNESMILDYEFRIAYEI